VRYVFDQSQMDYLGGPQLHKLQNNSKYIRYGSYN